MAQELEKRESQVTPRDWFSRWFEDWPAFPRWPEAWRSRLLEGWEPLRVEEVQEDDALVVKAEMPGIDPDQDVEITVSDQTLHIRAERRQESRSEEDGRVRSEFRYGSFARSVPLPAGATEEDVQASYKDGILEVRIPVDEHKAEARRIEVQRA